MINTIVSETDLTGKITFASDSFCRSSGYTKKELLGAKHSIVRHPDNPKEFFESLWNDIKQGKTWKGIIKNKNKFGGTYEVNVTIGPKYSKSNEIIGYYALRHQVPSFINFKQNKLDEAIIKYTKIIDNLTLGLVVIDRNDKILDYNNYFLKLFNIDFTKFSTFTFKSLYYYESEYKKLNKFKEVTTNLRTKPIITYMKKTNGDKVLVELNYFHLNDNQIMINIKDLTSYMNLSDKIEELK